MHLSLEERGEGHDMLDGGRGGREGGGGEGGGRTCLSLEKGLLEVKAVLSFAR